MYAIRSYYAVLDGGEVGDVGDEAVLPGEVEPGEEVEGEAVDPEQHVVLARGEARNNFV